MRIAVGLTLLPLIFFPLCFYWCTTRDWTKASAEPEHTVSAETSRQDPVSSVLAIPLEKIGAAIDGEPVARMDVLVSLAASIAIVVVIHRLGLANSWSRLATVYVGGLYVILTRDTSVTRPVAA